MKFYTLQKWTIELHFRQSVVRELHFREKCKIDLLCFQCTSLLSDIYAGGSSAASGALAAGVKSESEPTLAAR